MRDSKKISIHLQGVEQTLLIPLFSRAALSKKSYSLMRDEKAIELISRINYDFSRLSKNLSAFISSALMARAYQFDEVIRAYLRIYPKAVVVSLGAGLETAFYRLDNNLLSWVDIDLPEVISLRSQLFTAHERVHLISKSILENEWIEEVKSLGEHFIFFAGGFFMYFKEEEVKSIFLKLAANFPKSHLVFDVLSKKHLKVANKMLKNLKMQTAIFQWGFSSVSEIEAWSSQIKIIEQIGFFKELKNQPNIPKILYLKMLLYSYFYGPDIIHLEF